jgi:phosphatidylserine decarboxylase
MAQRLPIAREGWPFIAIPGALALALALLGRRRPALALAAAAAASAAFFRDPERAIPAVANGVLAPADGRVLSVEDADDPFVGRAVRVAIFLSPLDVHVNRAPIGGVVADVVYTPGSFKAAFDPAAAANERCAIRLQGEHARVTTVQIAGVLARRIVCRAGAGDKLAAGERYGMIRFGSRTDCYMPRGTEVTVRVGEQVRGGQTVIGVLPE